MLRAVFARKRGLRDGESLARFEATMHDVTVTQLNSYQDICGFPKSNIVPIPMPQIIAAPLHIALLTHPSFPIPVMGIVHVSNRITQERPIKSDETFDVKVWLEGHRPARKGCEFDLVTEIRIGDAKIWEAVTTVLSMAVKGHGKKSESPLIFQ